MTSHLRASQVAAHGVLVDVSNGDPLVPRGTCNDLLDISPQWSFGCNEVPNAALVQRTVQGLRTWQHDA
eukprot:CAMPEP_0180814442 /NCGR_PEP_ID=MMETSP1038_2-20121128/67075_1 /TAXON_ID=632150 /ORGANISM="Azadinium spinosum, Strain 3D9" /LENGTH=68 /DNA_ID=CAMNT_0022856109 /DNA_START=224 /DNA_END=430 /DNA_ORIENTATION=-